VSGVTPTIRKASGEDARIIRDLGIRIFTATFGRQNTPANMRAYLRSAFSSQRVRDEIADPASTHFLAEINGEQAGYARLHVGVAPPVIPGERPIELVRLYVDPVHQGTGVASMLMDACLDHALANGHDVTYLGVWENNARAIAFYRKWRFEKVGEHPFLLGDDRQTDWLLARVVQGARPRV
jgi:ribosomal protein S18 acetylase RimI-like enzyme